MGGKHGIVLPPWGGPSAGLLLEHLLKGVSTPQRVDPAVPRGPRGKESV